MVYNRCFIYSFILDEVLFTDISKTWSLKISRWSSRLCSYHLKSLKSVQCLFGWWQSSTCLSLACCNDWKVVLLWFACVVVLRGHMIKLSQDTERCCLLNKSSQGFHCVLWW
ncbi:hypothetical protein V8B55DRAFT_1567649 [Mucor lusitanicus]